LHYGRKLPLKPKIACRCCPLDCILYDDFQGTGFMKSFKQANKVLLICQAIAGLILAYMLTMAMKTLLVLTKGRAGF
jgi:hypothetical protein